MNLFTKSDIDIDINDSNQKTEKIENENTEKLVVEPQPAAKRHAELIEILRTDPAEGLRLATKNYLFVRSVTRGSVSGSGRSLAPAVSSGAPSLSGFTSALSSEGVLPRCTFTYRDAKHSYQGSIFLDIREMTIPIFVRFDEPQTVDEYALDSVYTESSEVPVEYRRDSENEPFVETSTSNPVFDLTDHVGLIAIAHVLSQLQEVMQRMDEMFWGVYCQIVVDLPEEDPFFVSIFRAMHSCRRHYVPLDILPMHTFGGLLENSWRADVEDLLSEQLINGWVDMNGNDSLIVWDDKWEVPGVYQSFSELV